MRVLFLADRLSARGGADWHLLGVLEDLARRHDVLLAVGRKDGTAEPTCRTELLPGLDARDAVPVEAERIARIHRPDVVHLHNVVNPEVLEWAAGRRSFVTVQDHRFFCPGRGKWTTSGDVCRTVLGAAACASCFVDDGYFEEILSLTHRRLEALERLGVIVLSRYMARELEAAGVARGRIAVIPPFVHGLELAAPPDGPPCILFVGRLVEPKGVLDVVRAWRLSGLDLPLVLAGTGRLRSQVERERNCEVLGWVRHERISSLYRRARALLMASRWQEPFGIVGLEALTFGVPVVAWDAGGVREWHPGGNGLVPWGDLEGLARELRAVNGRRAFLPPGFEREALMERLERLYRGDVSQTRVLGTGIRLGDVPCRLRAGRSPGR